MKGKGKNAKQSKLRRGLQKQRFVFNLKSVRCQEYKDYFDPSPEVESRLLGIPQTVSLNFLSKHINPIKTIRREPVSKHEIQLHATLLDLNLFPKLKAPNPKLKMIPKKLLPSSVPLK